MRLDRARFDRKMRELARLLNKSLSEVLRDEARLALNAAVKMTAPMTYAVSMTQSLAAQRRIGEEAVRRDVRQVFPTEIRNEKSAIAAVQKLARAGRSEEAEKILRDVKAAAEWVPGSTPSSAHHRKQRNRRGRVRRNPQRMIGPTEAAVAGYVRQRIKHVGISKAGWVTAARDLGLKLPRWIARNDKGNGRIIKLHEGTGRDSITMVNSVPWIADSKEHNRIAADVARSRERNFPKRLRMIKAGLRRAAAKRSK
jgi:hypothetical protein